jgi:hypothetical protein
MAKYEKVERKNKKDICILGSGQLAEKTCPIFQKAEYYIWGRIPKTLFYSLFFFDHLSFDL